MFGDFSLVKKFYFCDIFRFVSIRVSDNISTLDTYFGSKASKVTFLSYFRFLKIFRCPKSQCSTIESKEIRMEINKWHQKLDFCLLCCRLVISFLRNLTSQKMFYDLCNIFWLDLSKWCTTQDKKNILGVRISIALINYSDISKLFIAYFVSFFFSFWLLLYVVALNHALYFAHYGKNKISVQNIFWQKCTLNFEMYKIQSTLFCRK